MIKILMCTMSLDIGGAETHITELCKVLTRRGYEVTVASNGGVYVEELVRAGVKHVKLPLHSKKPSSVFRSYRGLKQLIRKEKFDIVHAHARIPAFVCGLLSKKLKFRFVTTAHGAFDINLLWKLISNWGEKTLAVSFDIKDYLTRNYGVPADNIGLTVNGIDTCKFSPSTDPSDVIEEFSLPESAHRILHVCRLDQASISVGRQLIQAAPQLVLRYPDVQIMIVGAGTAYGRLQAEAARVNREAGRDVVVLTGARTDVQKFCAWAEVFVGVSRAALEAMSAGCLAILSGNPEYNQGYTGIFRSDGLQSALDTNFTCRGSDGAQQGRLCEDICTLFSLPDEEKAQMRAYNRSVVCEYYSIEKMADDAVRMYESVTPYRRYRYGEILINGYYGFGNTGDDSLLHVIIEQIKAENKNARITVLSRSPKETARTHCVDSVNRFHPIALIRALRHAKVLIYGGGSLLQSATSSRSLAYYLYLLRAARAADVRTVLFANGIGPFSSEQDEKRAARAMESVDLITLRDSTSFATVRAMGVKNEHIYLSADPAFTMHGSGKRWCAHLLRSAHLPAGRVEAVG